MKGIFYAFGPKFKQNYTLANSSLLYNIDLFNLMCTILNINPCPASNGTVKHIEPFLKPNFDKLWFLLVIIALGIFVLIGVSWLIYSCRKNKSTSNIDRNNVHYSQIATEQQS